MTKYYTIMGYFPILRRKMDAEFKRVGFKNIKEKRWVLNKVLGKAPYLNSMSIVEMERIISELQKYNSVSEIE
ncbi:hypothetical protein BSP38_184 [Bacillus phage BSP38]|uniref:Uncharacterized protein n=1 Tax=Bacillus phage BSP38 TaxID=2283013 RepID=A0A345MK44_BPBSP|nr:hypothetical protein HWB82_gp134 [Bacillus phage BSP38]AXH71226.1 hypothetical protein BSP38_184 [Bacillus phage BSP38]